VLGLVDAGLDVRGDTALDGALTLIASLRGQVPDSVADAAISLSYRIFQRPELERAAERMTQRLETWLSSSDIKHCAGVLLKSSRGYTRRIRRAATSR
jgi:hypothetical protein